MTIKQWIGGVLGMGIFLGGMSFAYQPSEQEQKQLLQLQSQMQQASKTPLDLRNYYQQARDLLQYLPAGNMLSYQIQELRDFTYSLIDSQKRQKKSASLQ